MSHFELSDAEFLAQLLSCELNPGQFNHEAHLRLAWLHIHQSGCAAAPQLVDQQIQQFVQHLGAADKYHKTLTLAAVQVVCHFYQKSSSDRFESFILEFPQLITSFKSLLAQHYSYDLMQDEQARTVYRAPDLLVFD